MDIFITAAPVGAVPRYIDPKSIKYLPLSFVQALPDLEAALEKSKDWKKVNRGSLVITESTRISLQANFLQKITTAGEESVKLCQQEGLINDGSNLQYHPPELHTRRVLPKRIFDKIVAKELVNRLVFHLTSHGWNSGDGGLCWDHEGFMESYVPLEIVEKLKSTSESAFSEFLEAGWRVAGPGYVLSMKGASSFVPITPDPIIAESVAAASEGAAIIHLHTRNTVVESTWVLPWTTLPLTLASQANQIVPTDYEVIVPELRSKAPLAILNLSTSVRGGGDSESLLRQKHLKRYGFDDLAPEMCSMSPADVIFGKGGGYQNSPEFLERQLSHCRANSIRPEIEVFSRTILKETLGSFKARLSESGTPLLLMLVAGVDQKRRVEDGNLEDDSLIPTKQQENIDFLIREGKSTDIEKAIEMIVAELEPIVQEIRLKLPQVKISALLPGRMQQLLAPVAVKLSLDGVRVGLEDGLLVSDSSVPGGIRKGRTADQVRNLRIKLQALGRRVLSAEETRRVLKMPSATEKLFLGAMNALQQVELSDLDPMVSVSSTLSAFRVTFDRREQWLLEQVGVETWPEDPAKCAARVRELLQKAGLYVRYFIEERDRYSACGAKKINQHNIQNIQSLNYVYELWQEKGHNSLPFERALQNLARSYKISQDAFLTPMNQRKGSNLRFLEYLSFLPASFSPDRSEALNLGWRELTGYNHFHAKLFKAIEWEYRRMRSISEADSKSKGFLAFVSGQDEITVELTDLQKYISASHWIVLPSNPCTNYPYGIKLSKGLALAFLSYLKEIGCAPSPRLMGLVHSGQDVDGSVVIESIIVQNRFLLGTERHSSVIRYFSRIIYEAILLPRLVEQPHRLSYTSSGLAMRRDGQPLYDDNIAARRIKPSEVEHLPPLRFLAHSSGVSTMQQMDNAMRHDMTQLGYSSREQLELFNRNVIVSFGSAVDINCDVSGTPTVDITAYNDIRSMAGTTTPDYLIDDELRRKQSIAAQDEGFRYDPSKWKLLCGRGGKTVLRRVGVFLREDHLRQHDGHSIIRYLEGSPESVRTLLRKLHSSTVDASFDIILRQQGMNDMVDELVMGKDSWVAGAKL
jgi:uncharacterized protein (DUF849 family)